MNGSLKVGFYVFIPDYKGSGFAIVSHKEPLIYTTTDEFSAVAAAATSGPKEIPKLEPRESPVELYELIPSVNDGLDYFIKSPAGVSRYDPNKVSEVAFIDSSISHRYAPNPEFTQWMLHGDSIAVNAKNNTPFSKTPKVYFRGTQYNILNLPAGHPNGQALVEDLIASRLPYFTIPRGGLKKG